MARQPSAAAPLSAIRRTLIEQRPAGAAPGWPPRHDGIESPPLAEAPLHVHPAAGVGFVIEGTFESAFGDEPVTRVTAGHGFVDRAAVTHRVFRNPSATQPLRFVIAYTLPDGEAPLQPVTPGADRPRAVTFTSRGAPLAVQR